MKRPATKALTEIKPSQSRLWSTTMQAERRPWDNMQLQVTVNKLNKRSVVPSILPDKKNIVGVVVKGLTFEGTEVPNVPNPSLGKWYQDRDGYFYWGGGLKEQTVIFKTSPTAHPYSSNKQDWW